jgi:uncharacterized protein (DUF2062 family)
VTTLDKFRRGLIRRIVAMHGTPHGIALGFVVGLAFSLVPIPVLGMVAALALAPWIGANPPATYLGTAVVNPVTGAFIYILELRVGYAVLGQDPPPLEGLVTLDPWPWLEVFRTSLAPFLVGALVCAVVSTVVAYPSVWWLTHGVLAGVERARRRRRARHERALRGLLTADEAGASTAEATPAAQGTAAQQDDEDVSSEGDDLDDGLHDDALDDALDDELDDDDLDDDAREARRAREGDASAAASD